MAQRRDGRGGGRVAEGIAGRKGWRGGISLLGDISMPYARDQRIPPHHAFTPSYLRVHLNPGGFAPNP